MAEQLKGKRVLSDGQQKQLAAELERDDWSEGAGPKLKQLLMRGVGVHHAGVLPKYRRVVEELFQRKLLSVATCTETLSAGINLPARSVVMPSIMKGPPDKKKLLDPSTAHQIFGRAGRPQFDKEGHVYVLAHEDDVKIARWREKYDQIPEDTKDPGLMKAKKALKKKMPTRRSNEQYWNEAQFNKLCAAPPGNLYSRGPLPWRLLAYMLDASPEVDLIRRLVGKRLMDPGRIEAGPEGTRPDADDALAGGLRDAGARAAEEEELADQQAASPTKRPRRPSGSTSVSVSPRRSRSVEGPPPYRPMLAQPTESMSKLLLFRGIHPLYAVFLMNQLGIADRNERIQAMESVLELPRLGGPFRARAAAGRTAAGPAGHDAARSAFAATRAGHAGRDFAIGQRRGEPRPARAPTTKSGRGCSRWPTSSAGCSITISPACTTCGLRPSGRRANCCSLAAISTSTSPARPCKSKREWSSATCCG